MNNENKVILDLETYINMLDVIKELKQKANNYEVNYETMCKYLKEKVKNSEEENNNLGLNFVRIMPKKINKEEAL